MTSKTKILFTLYLLLLAIVSCGVTYAYQEQASLKKELAILKEKTDTDSAALKEAQNTLGILVQGTKEIELGWSEETKKRLAAEQSAAENSKGFEEKISLLGNELDAQKQKAASEDITSIIKEWSPKVARFSCNFENDKDTSTAKGSAIATSLSGIPTLVTNKHIVVSDGYKLSECSAYFPESDTEFMVPASAVHPSEKIDTAYADAVADSKLPASTFSPLRECSRIPALGDRVVILGYPSVGSAKTITATDGIISGFDKEYYITSAKIEQGNSGGAAILVKDNCLLGIPTLAVRGKLESLARILPLK